MQLVDFGLGVTFSDDSDVFREDVGSLYYVAPEVLARNYTKVSLRCFFCLVGCGTTHGFSRVVIRPTKW